MRAGTEPSDPRALPDAYYDQYVDAARSHWWFRGRERILAALARPIGPLPATAVIVDVGSGPDGPTRRLFPQGRIVALDVSVKALHAYAAAEGRLVANAERLPLSSASASAVCAFDILEHLDDDEGAIREWHRVLSPGGWLLLTVPAYMSLWSRSDDVDRHRRRYRARPLARMLEGAGFQITNLTYFNTVLLPGVALAKWIGRWWPAGSPATDGHNRELAMRLPRWMEHGLETVFGLESAWLTRASLPVGGSICAIASARRGARRPGPCPGRF